MNILYIEKHCPYSRKVINHMKKNNIKFELRDTDEKKHEKDLFSRSGKRQVPYLVDTNAQVEMHESNDIIEYLKTRENNK